MLSQFVKISLAGLFLLSLLFVTGCGNNVKVAGKVTYADGSPLETGKVVFENETFRYYGNIKADGTFALGVRRDGQGIPPGHYRVFIGEAFLQDFPPGGGIPAITYLIGERFRSAKTSGLEYDIQTKTTDIAITVEKPDNKAKAVQAPPQRARRNDRR